MLEEEKWSLFLESAFDLNANKAEASDGISRLVEECEE